MDGNSYLHAGYTFLIIIPPVSHYCHRQTRRDFIDGLFFFRIQYFGKGSDYDLNAEFSEIHTMSDW